MIGADLDQALESLERFKEAIFVVAQPVQVRVPCLFIRPMLIKGRMTLVAPLCADCYANPTASSTSFQIAYVILKKPSLAGSR